MKVKIKSKGFMLNYMAANGYTDDSMNGYDNSSTGVYIGHEMILMAGKTVDAEMVYGSIYDYQSSKTDHYDRWNWPEWAVEVVDED